MDIRNYILNLNAPTVIRNGLKTWKLINYSEKDWCDVFKGQKLTFRKGYKVYKNVT